MSSPRRTSRITSGTQESRPRTIDRDPTIAAPTERTEFVDVDGDVRSPDTWLPGRLLSERLQQIDFGEAHWRTYETLATDVLRYLFHPPLEAPQHNNWNFNGVDRRDIVLPNYATAGIWAFLRNQYRADFVVAEAKNYSDQVTKSEILQLANYLNIHGVGLFGLIIARHGVNSCAEWTMRQQWMSYNKMTVALNDDDLQEMLIMKDKGEDPTTAIRRKIEKFRLDI